MNNNKPEATEQQRGNLHIVLGGVAAVVPEFGILGLAQGLDARQGLDEPFAGLCGQHTGQEKVSVPIQSSFFRALNS